MSVPQMSPEAMKEALRPWIHEADAVERSWSFAEQGAIERALLYFEADAALISQLGQLGLTLGLDPALVTAWTAACDEADALAIGFHMDLSSVRLYVQHWDRLIDSGLNTQLPLYQGFKRLPNGSHRVDEYIAYPMASHERFAPPIRAGFEALGLDTDRSEQLISTFDPNALIWTEIQSPDRSSWLATVRRVHIPLQVSTGLLEPLKTTAPGDAMWRHAKSYPLTHIAGGFDTQKKRFISFYFEDENDELMRRLKSSR